MDRAPTKSFLRVAITLDIYSLGGGGCLLRDDLVGLSADAEPPPGYCDRPPYLPLFLFWSLVSHILIQPECWIQDGGRTHGADR